jgi:hypothetical protein
VCVNCFDRNLYYTLSTLYARLGTGPVPPVLLGICAKAEFFDLSGNDFDFPHEAKGGRSYQRLIVDHVRNLDKTELVDLQGQSDLTGEAANAGACSHTWLRFALLPCRFRRPAAVQSSHKP